MMTDTPDAAPQLSELDAARAEIDRMALALESCVNLLSIWRYWTPTYSTAYHDFESLPEVIAARAAIDAARAEKGGR